MKSILTSLPQAAVPLLETGGPNNTKDVALYTKTKQMSPPLNVAKALAET